MAEEKKKKYSSGSDIMTHLGAILLIILINYVLSFSFGRYDFTEDKRYSLSPKTIELLEDEERLNDRVFFRIYLDGDLPADLRKIRNSIQEMLDEFIIYAGDKIQYEFIDPSGTDDEDYNLEVQNQLAQQGLQWCMIDLISGAEREQKVIWPGALVEYGGITMDKVQFFRGGKIESEQQLQYIASSTISKLEYILVSAIRRVTETKKKTISFLHGHGELRENESKDVRMDLGEYYILDDVTINGQIHALDNTDLLVIARPNERFSEKDKFVIDQYIMRGGSVLWSIDPLNIPRDSLLINGQTIGMTANLNIEKDMLYKYGVRINADVVLDETCGPYYIPQSQEIIEWYFYPLLNRTDHLITKNLDPIRTEYPGSLDLVNESDTVVKKTVLLKSSANSRVFKAPARINYMITQVEPDFNDPELGDYPVAVLLEGRFTSAFKNKPISDAFLNSPDYTTLFHGQDAKMVVISDGDIMRNPVLDSAWTGQNWVYKFVPISKDMYGETNKDGTPKYVYDNKNFILNTVDYLLDDHSLIDIRTKSITLRQLDKAKIAQSKETWRVVNVMLPLVLLLILAIVQILVRKHKFASGKV